MKTRTLTVWAILALVGSTTIAAAQGGARGGGGGVITTIGIDGGGRGGRGGSGGMVVSGAPVSPTLLGLFTGTSVARDTLVLAQAVKVDAKYAAEIRAGRATRAGPPADSLVEKAKVATAKRAEELRALLKSDDDKQKFDENMKAMTTGRGGH